MNESDLRRKIEELGKGSFELGVEKIYSSFVGARRHLGIDKRFRSLWNSMETLIEEGLVENMPESREFMAYLIKSPTRYEKGNQEIKVLVREDSRGGLSGYTFSKVVTNREYF